MAVAVLRRRLGWLMPPAVPADGVMSLADHLRELRYRVIVAVVAIVVGAVSSAIFADQLYALLMRPYLEGLRVLGEQDSVDVTAINYGLTAPLMLWLKLAAVAGIVVACPIWLYQLWAFIAPGLLAREKKYALAFLAAAVPLFLLGIAIGYAVMPTAIAMLLSFTPESVEALIDLPSFLDFLVRMMLAFGLCFLLPVVVVALNLTGVVKARQFASARPYSIFGIFVIGAAATPSGDPFSMLALAVPIVVLYIAAEVICHVHDRRQRRQEAT